MHKRTYITALLQGKCPRCREGDVFAYPITRIRKFDIMHEKCPHCHVRFEPEPGFYQGAMYVGYGFTMAVIMVISLILYLAGNPSEWIYIGVIIAVMLLLVPVNYRSSRVLYLFLFGGIKHNPDLSQPK